MESILDYSPVKRKSKTRDRATPLRIMLLHAAGAHFVLCRGDHPDHRINPKTGKYEPKAAFQSSWPSTRPTVAEVYAHWLAGGWLGIVPASLDFLVLDKDSGSIRELTRYLRGRQIEYKSLKISDRRPDRPQGSHHVLIRASGLKIGNWNWAAAGCAGEMRHANGYVIAYSLSDWVKEIRTDRGLLDGDRLADFIQSIRTTSAGGSQAYDSALMLHGREVFNQVIQGKAVPSWAGHIARLEGMTYEEIKDNEAKAFEAAMNRIAWAIDEAGPSPYRDGNRAWDVYVAMLVLAGDGRVCWAEHKTIANVTAKISECSAIHIRSLRRAQKRLESDGWIVEQAAKPRRRRKRHGKKSKTYVLKVRDNKLVFSSS